MQENTIITILNSSNVCFKSKNYIVIYEANKLNSCFYA